MVTAALPIPDDEALVAYAVVGSTVGPFPVPFPLPADWQGSLRCKVGEIELAAGQFLFSPDSAVAGGFPTGNVTLTSAVSATTVEIWRDVPVSRLSDFGAGPLDFDAFNAELGRLTMQLQDVRLANLLSDTTGIVSPAVVPAVSAPTTDAAVGLLNGVLEVATKAVLSALTAGVVDAVIVRSRTTAGDGYAGTFIWRSGDQSANVTADPAGALWVAPDSDTDGSSGAWQRMYDGAIQARWFGPAGDGSTDDLTPLTRFLDLVMASDHRRGELDAKTYAISGALPQIDVPGVSLVGTGPKSSHDAGTEIATTTFKAITNSGFTMLTVAPDDGASNQRLNGNKVLGIAFDCNSLAAKGLFVKSVHHGEFDVFAAEATISGVELDCVTTLAEARDKQRNAFRIGARQFVNAAPGLRLKGNSGANVSFNTFERVNVAHANASAIVVEAADNNLWHHVQTSKSGGGSATNSIEWHGGAVGAPRVRAEHIVHLSCNVPALVKGLASYAVPATEIVIDVLNQENSSPDPTVEAGGSIRWGTERSVEGENAPAYNLIVNGDFLLNQLAPATNADKTAGFDGGVVLTQSNNIAISAVASPGVGQTRCLRLTQSNAVAQRMGYLFVIPSADTIPLRGKGVALSALIRQSIGGDVRCSISEWTGAVDAAAADIVNDWTSVDYTAGNFFTSTTHNVLAVMETEATASTWRELSGETLAGGLTATVGASANNLLVLIWTEGTVAQNVKLDIGRVRLLPGYMPNRYFPSEDRATLIERCERQVFKTYNLAVAPGAVTQNGMVVANASGATQKSRWWTPFRARMRAAPTATVYSTTGASGNVHDITATADLTASVPATAEGGVFVRPTANETDTNIYGFHVVATAYPWV